MSRSTLDKYRVDGVGPRYRKAGGRSSTHAPMWRSGLRSGAARLRRTPATILPAAGKASPAQEERYRERPQTRSPPATPRPLQRRTSDGRAAAPSERRAMSLAPAPESVDADRLRPERNRRCAREARAVARDACGGARGPGRSRLRDGAPCGPALRGTGADGGEPAGHAAGALPDGRRRLRCLSRGAHDEAVLAARIEAATGAAVRFVARPRGRGSGLRRLRTGSRPPVPSGPARSTRLLDAWTEAAGQEWHFNADAGRIEIVRQRTGRVPGERAGRQRAPRRLVVDAGPGRRDGSASLSAQSIESETVYDPWPEIEAQIAGLGGRGRPWSRSRPRALP